MIEQAVRKLGQPIRVKSGARIFERGQPSRNIYFVVSGRLKICAASLQGREVILDIVGPGELIGISVLLDGAPRFADGIAEKDCELLALDIPGFKRLLLSDPKFIYAVLEQELRRRRRRTEQLEDLAFLKGSGRLAKWLIRSAADQNVCMRDGAVVDVDCSQRIVGLLAAGMSRESVNRQLKTLAQRGIISQSGKQVTILNATRLQQTADGVLVPKQKSKKIKQSVTAVTWRAAS